MFKFAHIKPLLMGSTLLALSASASAHMLWLAPAQNNQTHAYYGEFSAGELENQTGALKTFNTAKAQQGKKELTAKVESDHLVYATTGDQDVRVSQDMLYEDTLINFLAKTGRQNSQTSMEMEIAPVATNAKQFTVIFDGKPLAGQEVVVFAPNRWSKTYYTDDKGQFSVETPWTGLYVIEAGKAIEQGGKYQGKAYKSRYIVSTLSFEID